MRVVPMQSGWQKTLTFEQQANLSDTQSKLYVSTHTLK